MNWRFLYLLPCFVISTGCVSTVTIDADDSVSFSELSTSLPLNDENTRLRFRAARASGSFDQHVGNGERILIDDSSIFGPAEVDGDLDLSYYSIALGWISGEIDPTPINFGFYLGVAQTRFDLTLASEGNEFDTRDATTEIYLQYLLSTQVADKLDFGFSWAFSLGRELSGISELDLRLEYRLLENLALAGGYRWLEYQYGLGDDESHLEVKFRGPYLGLYFPF